METVFHISNCTMENQIKFATCTLFGSALTWWNAHVRTVGHDVAYAMTWTNLKKMMTDKYCPGGKMTDNGLPDMIHGSVMAYKPKTMQDAIEFTTELMDKKINTFAERQAKNKRKLDNNNQAQQQPPKKQGGYSLYCWACWPLDPSVEGKFQLSYYVWNIQRNLTFYECGNQGHYKSDCPKLKNQNHEKQAEGTEARGMVYALGGGETDQDLNDMEDDIDA
ncbi:RNA-directed DNA polymerase, eukaryota [Tanacetum coccineum]